MPKLPEVEARWRVLEPQIKRLMIKRVTANRPEVIAHPPVNEFCNHLTGQILIVSRAGRNSLLFGQKD